MCERVHRGEVFSLCVCVCERGETMSVCVRRDEVFPLPSLETPFQVWFLHGCPLSVSFPCIPEQSRVPHLRGLGEVSFTNYGSR